MAAYDVSFIATVMHDSQMEGCIDPETRTVYFGFDGEITGDDGEPLEEIPDAWISIEHVSTHEAYEDMVAFASAVGDRHVRERLLAALEGRGAFRRFRDAVHREEVGRSWGAYQEARQALRVVEWLGATKLLPEGEARAASAGYERTLEGIRGQLGGTTDADLAAVEALERELQTPACRGDARRLVQLLADDFEEIGASGHVWNVVDVVDVLLAEDPGAAPIEVRDLAARYVADDLVLVRWESVCGERRALRTSLWRRDLEGWRLTHHQATPLV